MQHSLVKPFGHVGQVRYLPAAVEHGATVMTWRCDDWTGDVDHLNKIFSYGLDDFEIYVHHFYSGHMDS